MMMDQKLSDTNIPIAVLRKLEDLAIGSVRQLYARLRYERSSLREHLQLPDADFDEFYREIEELIRTECPEDALPQIRSTVNKTGVAVRRLHDPTRPRY